jgi:23S rRNA (cytosine1962-C5)-methyltransferase
MKSHIFVTPPQKEYALLDSGDGMKLERYGTVKIARPDPQALWRKKLPESAWKNVDAYFNIDKGESEKGKWVILRPGLPDKWNIEFGELRMNIKLTPFKHTGLFPEQYNNWMWCRDVLETYLKHNPDKKPSVLNLFGYTGGATISAAYKGAEVTHVDASRSAITWANENAKSSNLEDKPIRWILDDAFAFVRRELRRGKKYDAIIMDPPAFGRGAKGEIWKIEEHFLELFESCLELLSDTPLFVVVNGYAAGYSAIAYENNMSKLVDKHGGSLESGELTLEEEGPRPRLLPCGIVSRWKKFN